MLQDVCWIKQARGSKNTFFGLKLKQTNRLLHKLQVELKPKGAFSAKVKQTVNWLKYELY